MSPCSCTYVGIKKSLMQKGQMEPLNQKKPNYLRQSALFNLVQSSIFQIEIRDLKPIIKALTAAKVAELRNIPMGTGNKTSRVVAWTFMTQEKQEEWIKNRWS